MYHLVIQDLSEENLPFLAVMVHVSFSLLVHRTSLMDRYTAPLLSNKPANVYEYDLSQPTQSIGKQFSNPFSN